MIHLLLAVLLSSCPLDRISVEGLPPSSRFGVSVCFFPGGLAVGAGRDQLEPFTPVGLVNLFEADSSGHWVLTERLADPVPQLDAGFGLHLACSDDRIAAGAFSSDVFGSSSGTVVLFTRSGEHWEPLRLVPSDVGPGRFFGPVAIDGDIVAAAAHGTDSDGFQNTGVVYIFEYNGADWVETAIIEPPAEDLVDTLVFGFDISLSGNTLAVGAKGGVIDGMEIAGRAYVYERAANGSWSHAASFTSDSPGVLDGFGSDIATDGHRVVVGAQQRLNGQPGEAFVFARGDDGVWVQEHHLVPELAEYDAAFGFSVAIQNDLVAVGSPFTDVAGEDMGRVYLYDLNDVEHPRTFEPPAWVFTSSFGTSVDFDRYSGRSRLAIGAWSDDTEEGHARGAAYVIELDACAICPEDIDLSDDVGFSDLLHLLHAWGAHGPTDLNDDGATGPADLMQLLENWGPCS